MSLAAITDLSRPSDGFCKAHPTVPRESYPTGGLITGDGVGTMASTLGYLPWDLHREYLGLITPSPSNQRLITRSRFRAGDVWVGDEGELVFSLNEAYRAIDAAA
jgi:hypothetical protein